MNIIGCPCSDDNEMLRGRLFLHVDAYGLTCRSSKSNRHLRAQFTFRGAHWDVLEAIIGYLHICGGNVPTPQHWWRFSGLAWASSPLGARDETATVPVTTASGINQCYARSASITRPMGILRSGLMGDTAFKVERRSQGESEEGRGG